MFLLGNRPLTYEPIEGADTAVRDNVPLSWKVFYDAT
jgi:hypothetical protein